MSNKVAEALDFFGLPGSFTKEQLNSQYHKLARQYHPDAGEYTTSAVFLKLVEYRDILSDFLNNRISEELKEDDYSLYKKAKNIENRSVIDYFKKTEGNRVFLKEEENRPLSELKSELKQAQEIYLKILQTYPDSIWREDIQASLKKIAVWFH